MVKPAVGRADPAGRPLLRCAVQALPAHAHTHCAGVDVGLGGRVVVVVVSGGSELTSGEGGGAGGVEGG